MKAGGGRAKGHAEERSVAKWLRSLFPNAERNGDGKAQSDLKGVPGWCVQVKHAKAPNVWEALEQAKAEARPGEVPVVIANKNRRGRVVVMDPEHWLELVRKAGPPREWGEWFREVQAQCEATSHGAGKSEKEPEAQGGQLD